MLMCESNRLRTMPIGIKGYAAISLVCLFMAAVLSFHA